MRIPSNPPPTVPIRAKGRTSDGFAPRVAERSSPAPVTQVQVPTSIDLLLVLASMEDGTERRRKMAEQAERGIAALEKLEAAVAAGEPDKSSLQELASWAENVPPPEDPELQKIVDAVRIRALVELAKRDRDGDIGK